MLEKTGFKEHFLKTNSINLKKSRRYSILKRECEIDGYSAVCLFINDGIFYGELNSKIEGSLKVSERSFFESLEMSPRYFSNNLSQFIEKIGFSLEDICSLFKLDSYKARIILGRGGSLPLSTCLHLENLTQVCLPLWFSKKLDVDSVAKNWLLGVGKKIHLPASYIVEEGSKVRLFETAVLFVDEKLGFDYSSYILSYLQITRDLFSYPDKNISLSLFRDFHKCLRFFDVDDQFFINMGAYNIATNKLARIDFNQRITNPTVQGVFNNFSDTLAPRVDKNYEYQSLSVNEEKVVIYSKPRGTSLGSFEVALYRLGHLCNLPLYFNLKPMSVMKSTIDYNNETDECTFHLLP
jgi:hypothetical protein